MYEVELTDPAENGGYLVLPTEGTGGVEATTFGMLYPYLVGCTFPVSGAPAVQRVLCPGFDPKRSGDRHVLVKKFGHQGFRFLFLPRVLFELLYFRFLIDEKLAPAPQYPSGLTNPDCFIYGASNANRGDTATYFVQLVEDQKSNESQHWGHFNAWAVHFLSANRLMRRDRLDAGCIHTLKDDGVFAAIKLLSSSGETTLSALEGVFLTLAQLELASLHCTFLTRFAESSANCYITSVENFGESNATVTAKARSASFGPDLFAGLFGDTHACTLTSLGGRSTAFAFPLDIGRFRQGEGVEGLFWVPPYPTPLQCRIGMNDFWHPRSRLVVRELRLEEQVPEGVNMEFLSNFMRSLDVTNIKPLQFLFYAEGQPFPDDHIVKLSMEVEAYVSKNSSVLFVGDPKATGSLGMKLLDEISQHKRLFPGLF